MIKVEFTEAELYNVVFMSLNYGLSYRRVFERYGLSEPVLDAVGEFAKSLVDKNIEEAELRFMVKKINEEINRLIPDRFKPGGHFPKHRHDETEEFIIPKGLSFPVIKTPDNIVTKINPA